MFRPHTPQTSNDEGETHNGGQCCTHTYHSQANDGGMTNVPLKENGQQTYQNGVTQPPFPPSHSTIHTHQHPSHKTLQLMLSTEQDSSVKPVSLAPRPTHGPNIHSKHRSMAAQTSRPQARNGVGKQSGGGASRQGGKRSGPSVVVERHALIEK